MKVDHSKQEEILRQYAEKAITFDAKIEIAQVSFDGPEENILANVTLWHPDKVDLNLCEKVSGLLNEMLDKKDPFKETYTLEVSSLSLTRKLKTPDDFRRAIGETIAIKFREKEKPDYTGLLIDWQNDNVTVQQKTKNISTPYSEIKHASIVF